MKSKYFYLFYFILFRKAKKDNSQYRKTTLLDFKKIINYLNFNFNYFIISREIVMDKVNAANSTSMFYDSLVHKFSSVG